MDKKLSHDDVRSRMQQFLYTNLATLDKSMQDDEIYGDINGQKVVIIAPVKLKQRPSLECKIEENSGKRIATSVVLPKSSSSYEGNYLKDAGKTVTFEKWGNNVELTTSERYLCDIFKNSIPYFDPVKQAIEHMSFRRYSEWHIANSLGIRLNQSEDKALCDRVEQLREERGEGHIAEKLTPAALVRYGEIKRVRETRERIREKLCDKDKPHIKDVFTIQVYEIKDHETKKTLLLANLILPNYPIQGQLL